MPPSAGSRPSSSARSSSSIPPLPSRPALLAFIGLLVALGPAPALGAPRPAATKAVVTAGSAGPSSQPVAPLPAARPDVPAPDDTVAVVDQCGPAPLPDRSSPWPRRAEAAGVREGGADAARRPRPPSRRPGRPRRATPTGDSSPVVSLPSATSSSSSSSSRGSVVHPSALASGSSTVPTQAPTVFAQRAAHMFGVVTSRAIVDKYEVQDDGTGWALATDWELYGVQLAVESSDAAPTATADEVIATSAVSSSHLVPSPTKLPPGWGSGDRDEFEVPLIVVISVGLTCIVLATIFTFLARRNKQRQLVRRAKRYEEKKLRRAREAVEAAEAAALVGGGGDGSSPPTSGAGGEMLQIPRAATFSAGRGSVAGDGASIVSSATSSSRSSSNRFGGGGGGGPGSGGGASGGGGPRQRLGRGRMVGTLRSAGKNFMRISKGKGRAAPVETDEPEAIIGDDDDFAVDQGSVRSLSHNAAERSYADQPSSSNQPLASPGISAGVSPEQIVVITDTDADPLPGPPPHPSHHPTPPTYQSASSSGRLPSAGAIPRPTGSVSDDGHLSVTGPGSPRRPTRASTADGSPLLGPTGDDGDDDHAPPPLLPTAALPALPSFPRDAKVPLRPPSPPSSSSNADSALPSTTPTSAEAAAVLARHARHVATDDKALLARMAAEGPSAPPESDGATSADDGLEGSAPPVWEAADSLDDHQPSLQLEQSSLPPPIANSVLAPLGPSASSAILPAPPRQWGQKTLADPYAETTARLLSALDDHAAGASPSYPSSGPSEPPSAPPLLPDDEDAEAEASAPPFHPNLDAEDTLAHAPTAPTLSSAAEDEDEDQGHIV